LLCGVVQRFSESEVLLVFCEVKFVG
jgi:hypothetical protein